MKIGYDKSILNSSNQEYKKFIFRKEFFVIQDKKILKELVEKVKKIPGKKKVTLISQDSVNPELIVDIDEENNIGYSIGHESLFKAKLSSAIKSGGALMIRQFTNIEEDGIPVKKLYGVALGQGTYIGITKEELKKAYETDSKTGEEIPGEKNAIYYDFK